jgi:DNA-binding CsgD family transcriptional regulator
MVADTSDEDFIDRIYDSILQPHLWDQILVEISDMMQSAGGAAFGMLTNGQGSAFCHYGRYQPPEDQRLSGHYMINPWTAAVMRQPVGAVLPSHRILPLRDLRRTAFYADILGPEKLDHCVITTVSRTPSVNFAFNIMRSDKVGPFSEAEVAKLRALMPHLRRAAELRLSFEGYRDLSLRQQQILDQINTGVILIDEMGAYRCANIVAEEMLRMRNGLTLQPNALVARDHKTTKALERLIAETAAGGVGGTVPVPRETQDPLLILVYPLRGTIRDALTVPGRARQTVVLFIKDPARGFSGPDSVLGPLFQLTPAEVRVALALGRSESVEAAAAILGRSINTVKTHIKRVYEKMGVGSHAELVQKIAKLASF